MEYTLPQKLRTHKMATFSLFGDQEWSLCLAEWMHPRQGQKFASLVAVLKHFSNADVTPLK